MNKHSIYGVVDTGEGKVAVTAFKPNPLVWGIEVGRLDEEGHITAVLESCTALFEDEMEEKCLALVRKYKRFLNNEGVWATVDNGEVAVRVDYSYTDKGYDVQVLLLDENGDETIEEHNHILGEDETIAVCGSMEKKYRHILGCDKKGA